jgi:hypothetical protein
MNLKDLKKMIEDEVSTVVGTTLTEPELQKPKPSETKTVADVSDEELDNFMFHGQSKQQQEKEDGKTDNKKSRI